VVAGGGAGGLAAAVAAARNGAKVLLLEREGCLGGGATTMLVQPMMPSWTKPSPNGEPSKVINAGIFAEIFDRLEGRQDVDQIDWGSAFDDEIYRNVLDEMAAEAGVQVIFHASLYDVETQAGCVQASLFSHNSGPLRAEGAVFIDGTGDALLSALAGCACRVGDEDGVVMPMTLNFIVAGVDTDRLPHSEMHEMARRGRDDDPPLINTNISCHHVIRKGYVHFNAIRVPGSTTDPLDLSRAEMESRRRVENFVQWLRAKVPGCENAFLIKTGNHIGIRESRRVVGDYMLTGEDFSRAAKFEDAIACCAYEIDIHPQKPGSAHFEHLPPGEYYQIPYRCLTPKGVENLLVASRSISADVWAHGSLRIMPSVMCIGQAAGTAAALSLPEGRVRSVDVGELRRRIVEAGGVL